ncbi:hypothetical protein MRX96_006172 [Rhipicephalus microplus]
MNDLFDCLNSRRPQDVQYNEAEHIATLKANIKWLEDCCTYIESLPKQRQVCFLSKPTCGALRMTLHSTVALIDRLLKSGFRYVLVVNLDQDPLGVIQVYYDERSPISHSDSMRWCQGHALRQPHPSKQATPLPAPKYAEVPLLQLEVPRSVQRLGPTYVV